MSPKNRNRELRKGRNNQEHSPRAASLIMPVVKIATIPKANALPGRLARDIHPAETPVRNMIPLYLW